MRVGLLKATEAGLPGVSRLQPAQRPHGLAFDAREIAEDRAGLHEGLRLARFTDLPDQCRDVRPQSGRLGVPRIRYRNKHMGFPYVQYYRGGKRYGKWAYRPGLRHIWRAWRSL